MKAKSFINGLIITIIALLLIAFSLWKLSFNKTPLNLKEEVIEIPDSARFIPKENLLTIHLKIDPDSFPQYVEAAAPREKRKLAKKASIKLRNGIFALIGLDFEKDISNNIGSRISFSIFRSLNEDHQLSWLLILEDSSKDNKQLLEDFWERKKLLGINNEEKNINNIKIISEISPDENNNLIATAFTDKNEVLIASNVNALKQSLETSNKPEKSQMLDKSIINLIPNLSDSISLISISKEGLNLWFNVPDKITKRNDFDQFIGSIKVKEKNLFLEGIFNFNDQIIFFDQNENNDQNFLHELGANQNMEDIAILNNTSDIFNENNQNPISNLIEPLIIQYINNIDLINIKRIAEVESGKLVFANDQGGWIIGTNKNGQEESINKSLTNDDFINESISVKDNNLKIWSRLRVDSINNYEYETVNKEIAFLLDDNDDRNWWSNQLALIQKRKANFPITSGKDIFFNMKNKGITEKISLGRVSSQNLMKQWKPWILMEKIIGSSIEKNIKRLSVSIGSNQDETNSQINFLAKLSLD